MITIRTWLEVTTPATERVYLFPISPESHVRFRFGEKLSLKKKIDVDCKAYEVEGVGNTPSSSAIRIGLSNTTFDFPEGYLISFIVDVIYEAWKEPGE